MHLAQDFQELLSISALISLLTLSVLEIVLGIDNIIFISIVAGKLPKEQQPRARTIGLVLALIMRVALLSSISWIAGLKDPFFYLLADSPFFSNTLPTHTDAFFGVTGRDIILFCGGVFLLYKTTIELHNKVQGYDEEGPGSNKALNTLGSIIFQIVLIDIVFSFDSILTAVGLVTNLVVMILAVIIAMIIMIMFSGKVSDFINENPTIKVLALSFLLMIGTILVLESAHQHINKSFIYVSIGFSLFVEVLNIRMRKKQVARDSNNDPRDVI